MGEQINTSAIEEIDIPTTEFINITITATEQIDIPATEFINITITAAEQIDVTRGLIELYNVNANYSLDYPRDNTTN